MSFVPLEADEDSFACVGLQAGKTLRSVGVVGRCLSKKLADGLALKDGCKSVVTIAAPKDASEIFSGALAGVSILEKVAALERGAGMKGTLVDADSKGYSMITLTGWVALASMGSLVIVIIGAVVFCYRKYTGKDRPYTLVVKGGDV